jgi:hypothetical protein
VSDDSDSDDSGLIFKLVASGIVVVLAIPGLIIEPGPITEIAALGILSALWLGDASAAEAAQEATSEGGG